MNLRIANTNVDNTGVLPINPGQAIRPFKNKLSSYENQVCILMRGSGFRKIILKISVHTAYFCANFVVIKCLRP